MKIRAARADEAEKLTQLAVRATRSDGYDAETIGRIMPALDTNVALLAGGQIFVAEDATGQALGHVSLRRSQWPGVVLLEAIFVDPEQHRRGVGTFLFEFALEWARRMSGVAMMIFANPPAVPFYERLGAITFGKVPFVYSAEIMLSVCVVAVPSDSELGHSPTPRRTPA
jgi:GNAT superfamily N-acetyltransferase